MVYHERHASRQSVRAGKGLSVGSYVFERQAHPCYPPGQGREGPSFTWFAAVAVRKFCCSLLWLMGRGVRYCATQTLRDLTKAKKRCLTGWRRAALRPLSISCQPPPTNTGTLDVIAWVSVGGYDRPLISLRRVCSGWAIRRTAVLSPGCLEGAPSSSLWLTEPLYACQRRGRFAVIMSSTAPVTASASCARSVRRP